MYSLAHVGHTAVVWVLSMATTIPSVFWVIPCCTHRLVDAEAIFLPFHQAHHGVVERKRVLILDGYISFIGSERGCEGRRDNLMFIKLWGNLNTQPAIANIHSGLSEVEPGELLLNQRLQSETAVSEERIDGKLSSTGRST